MSTPTGSQNLTNLGQLGSLHGNSQPQQTQPITKPNLPAPAAPVVSAGISNSASQWPKISQSDIQKYMKVFGDVDRDRDGKITGAEARTLFLSWRLPRGGILSPTFHCPNFVLVDYLFYFKFSFSQCYHTVNIAGSFTFSVDVVLSYTIDIS
jgi:hypothetical protein